MADRQRCPQMLLLGLLHDLSGGGQPGVGAALAVFALQSRALAIVDGVGLAPPAIVDAGVVRGGGALSTVSVSRVLCRDGAETAAGTTVRVHAPRGAAAATRVADAASGLPLLATESGAITGSGAGTCSDVGSGCCACCLWF